MLGYTSVTFMDGHMVLFLFSHRIRWANRHINQALSLGSYALLARLTILSIILQYLFVLQLVCVWLSVCLCRFVIQMHTYLHWLYSWKSKQEGINKARYKKELSQERSQLMHCSRSFCLHLFSLKRIVAHASMFGLYKYPKENGSFSHIARCCDFISEPCNIWWFS